MPYNYYLGMPRLVTETLGGVSMSAFKPPAGTIGWIDFRPPGALASEAACGFFAVDSGTVLGLDYVQVGSGDCRSIIVGNADAAKWQSVTGYKPKGSMLVDYVHDQLTDGASVNGSSVAPLMPESVLVGGVWVQSFVIHLSGHSPIVLPHQKPKSNGHWAKVKAVRQQTIKQAYDDCQKPGAKNQNQWKSVWGMVCEVENGKSHINDKSVAAKNARKALLPVELQTLFAGDPAIDAVPPQTSYSDTFNRADENPIASPWTYQGADAHRPQIVSNGVCKQSSAASYTGAYYSVLSSADQWSQISQGNAWSTDWPQPIIRNRTADTAGVTGFGCGSYSTFGFYTLRFSDGSRTDLNNTTGNSADGNIYKIDGNGSTITSYLNGSSKWTGTDTNHASNLYPGLMLYGLGNGTTYKADDWSAADSAAAVAGPVLFANQYLQQGIR